MIIRSATKNDVPTLVKFWQAIEAFPGSERPFGGNSADKPAKSKSLIKNAIASENAVVLVAVDNEKELIGTISGHVFEKHSVNISKIGVIYSLWVKEDFRCRGIATALLNQLEQGLKNRGAGAFQVGWDISNELAATWWQKRGFNADEVVASKIPYR